jgi:hypothetical protein
MEGADLAFYTTEELVSELIGRKTFLGLVLHSEQEMKQHGWTGEQVFRLHFNANLKPEEACRLLDTVADHLDC